MQSIHDDYTGQVAGSWAPPDTWLDGVRVHDSPVVGERRHGVFESRHSSMAAAWGTDSGCSQQDLALRIDGGEVHPRNRGLLQYTPGYAGARSAPGAGAAAPPQWRAGVYRGAPSAEYLHMPYDQPALLPAQGPFAPSLAAEGFASGRYPYLADPRSAGSLGPQGYSAGSPQALAAGDARPDHYGPPGPRGGPPPCHNSGYPSRDKFTVRDGNFSLKFGTIDLSGFNVLLFILLVIVALVLFKGDTPRFLILTPTAAGSSAAAAAGMSTVSAPAAGLPALAPPAAAVPV